MRVCLLLLLVLCSPFHAVAQTTVVFADEDTIYNKICTDILREAFAKLGLRVETKPMSLARSLSAANDGVIDGVEYRSAGREVDFNNLIMVPTAIFETHTVAFTKPGLARIASLDAARNVRIGIVIGVGFVEQATRDFPRREVVPDHAGLFSMVEKGRVDAALVEEIAGLTYLKDLSYRNIVVNSPPLLRVEAFTYLNKRLSNIVGPLAAILDEMKKNGRIDAIRARHIQGIKDLLGQAAASPSAPPR